MKIDFFQTVVFCALEKSLEEQTGLYYKVGVGTKSKHHEIFKVNHKINRKEYIFHILIWTEYNYKKIIIRTAGQCRLDWVKTQFTAPINSGEIPQRCSGSFDHAMAIDRKGQLL